MGWTIKSLALLFGLPVLGFCATALYLLHRKDDDEDLDDLGIKTSRVITIETKIPKSSVGVIIGRGGSNIKKIQEECNARISFKDEGENENFRTCIIKGSAEATQMAEALILEMIWNQPVIEVVEMWVPSRAVGRIIGRCGETIRNISKASNARINVENNVNKKNETRIVIKGSTEQIAVAKSLIQDKVEEDAEIRRKMELSQANRSPRNKASSPVNTTAASSKNVEKERKEVSEPLIATGSDGFLQVYVSAVADPGCFWVQVRSPRSVELDHLVDEMTEYYSQEENKQIHIIKDVAVGQIVAAQFPIVDNKWYRAEVRAVEPNEHDSNESRVDLYYVDYGDSEYLKQREVFQLRTDFLTLRFQAIECNLANVKPSDGDKWSEQATDLFEELCHVAQWRPMLAKVITFKEKQRGQREGSPVPCISLFDTSGSQDIDVAEELVKHGFAVKDEMREEENVFLMNNGTPGDAKFRQNRHGGESNSLTSPTELNGNPLKKRWVATYDGPDTRDDWDM